MRLHHQAMKSITTIIRATKILVAPLLAAASLGTSYGQIGIDPIEIEPVDPPCPSLLVRDIQQEVPNHTVRLVFPAWPDIDASSLSDGDLVAQSSDGLAYPSSIRQLFPRNHSLSPAPHLPPGRSAGHRRYPATSSRPRRRLPLPRPRQRRLGFQRQRSLSSRSRRRRNPHRIRPRPPKQIPRRLPLPHPRGTWQPRAAHPPRHQLSPRLGHHWR